MKGSSLFSWVFRRGEPSSSSPEEQDKIHNNKKKKLRHGGGDASVEELGVTEELQEFVKGFTVQTFKEFPFPFPQPQPQGIEAVDSSDGSRPSPPFSNVRKDLTDWQERHATLVLTTVKEISKLRYVLCPQHLKENQFWTIYFMLVKCYTAPYEIRAIQKEKLKLMELEHEKSVQKVGYELEMQRQSKCEVVHVEP